MNHEQRKPQPKPQQPKPQPNPIRKSPGDKPGPLGEGNYEAARKYNEGVMAHMREHDVDQEARDAAPRTASEAKEMKEAERSGASRAKEEDPALRPKRPPR